MKNHNHNINHILNTFSPQHPAQPEYFAGRKTEIDYFRESVVNSAKLSPPTPLNYAILGTWGMGKTSLLYEFKEIALHELNKDIKCVGIHFPLSSQSGKTWDVFSTSFTKTISSTTEATRRIRTLVRGEMKKWAPTVGVGVASATRTQKDTVPDVLEVLERLWKKHLKPSGTEIALIFLDDLQYFPVNAEDSPYLNLRAVFQELVNRKCNYSLAITADTGLFTSLEEFAEPFTRFFKRFELKPFTKDETKEAVEKRLNAGGRSVTLDDAVIDSVMERTLGHPYLVMFVMYELLSRVKERGNVTGEAFDKAWPGIEEAIGETVFLQKYNSASPSERQLMIAAAKSESEVFSPSEFRQFKSVNELFSRLEQKELLIRRTRGKYSLFHPLFSAYLLGQ